MEVSPHSTSLSACLARSFVVLDVMLLAVFFLLPASSYLLLL
jgi:hypothetical protein